MRALQKEVKKSTRNTVQANWGKSSYYVLTLLLPDSLNLRVLSLCSHAEPPLAFFAAPVLACSFGAPTFVHAAGKLGQSEHLLVYLDQGIDLHRPS